MTGQPFPGNVIPSNRFDPMGRALLLLAPLPNNVRDQTTNAYNNSNFAQDLTPEHTRTNFITRVDAVLGSNTRLSGRALFDRDNAIAPNNIAPGVGEINNNFPGNLINGTMTKVLSPSMVNETIVGYSWNHWGHRVGTGACERLELHAVVAGERRQPAHQRRRGSSRRASKRLASTASPSRRTRTRTSGRICPSCATRAATARTCS